MSDLIGFYIAVGLERYGIDQKREFRRKCGVLGLNDDPATRLGKQVEAFYSSYSDSQGFNEQVRDWFSPKLHCIDGCEGEPQHIPSELLEFTPIPPSVHGLWNWSFAYAKFPGSRWIYDVGELNRQQ